MNILRLAESPPPSVALTTTVRKSARAFRRAHSGALVVLDHGKLAGILSERDLTLRVIDKGLDPKTTLVSDVMTAPVERVLPDASLDDALERMASRHVRHLVVVDELDRPIGLLSLRDAARARIERASDELRTLEAFVGAGDAGD